MKQCIFLLLFLLASFVVSANDTPCQVDLYQSQSQFNKAMAKSDNKNIERLLSQKNITLPEVMAKADRFKIIRKQPKEHVVQQQNGHIAAETPEPVDTESKLGGMFELLIPAKLRNPAR